MTRRRHLASLLGVLLALGCRQGTDEPVDPVWGKQPCAHCAMLVSDSAYAAQLVGPYGERRYFDDVGCLALWLREHGAPPRMWVRAATDDGWVDARTTRYRSDARTPMDFGFVAAQSGLSWDEVQTRTLARAAAATAGGKGR